MTMAQCMIFFKPRHKRACFGRRFEYSAFGPALFVSEAPKVSRGQARLFVDGIEIGLKGHAALILWAR
jgi:hypothetical protein